MGHFQKVYILSSIVCLWSERISQKVSLIFYSVFHVYLIRGLQQIFTKLNSHNGFLRENQDRVKKYC